MVLICKWIGAHRSLFTQRLPLLLDQGMGCRPWMGLILGTGRNFCLSPLISVENSFTAHNCLIKVLLSQTGTDLLLSSECPRCGHLPPASTKDL